MSAWKPGEPRSTYALHVDGVLTWFGYDCPVDAGGAMCAIALADLDADVVLTLRYHDTAETKVYRGDEMQAEHRAWRAERPWLETPVSGRVEPVSAGVNPTPHLSKSPVHIDESPNL